MPTLDSLEREIIVPERARERGRDRERETERGRELEIEKILK